MQDRRHAVDPSEARAARRLARDSAGRTPSTDDAHSVYNEPAVLPGQEGQPISCDWSCRQCGYNLRGLRTGHPCPECGNIEIYYPPPAVEPSFAKWLSKRQGEVSAARSWSAVIVAGIAGGPFAILGALLTGPMGPWLTTVVAAPVVEEVLKIAAAAWLVETRPHLIRRSTQIFIMGGVSGLVFALIENLVYLVLYGGMIAPFQAAWRWVVCTLFHVGCSLVGSAGLARVWTASTAEMRPPRLSLSTPSLIAAMLIHGAYNALMSTLAWSGLLF